ncbi:uncharacterized protein LOC107995786 isoform X2 [Apis cerana]|uniref:uncharacterized protein LOC107995786 isoform X2 n=1 Tax=Apis cerana TaxID=7461 RepID=UPI002B233B89|nr:uncharacterized protein LOC107995786 isoform X2 [Apis cerana]
MFFQRLGKLVFRRNLKMTTSLNRGLIVLSLLTVSCRANELKDYCSIHKFDNLPPGGLRFTKEVVTTEYANIGAFKALHCCLRGYRSIEWYKDNRAYPWPGGESHFILYPESANQTIYAQKVRASDAGRYSCQARNDTTILEGDITLAVLGEKSSGYTGKPLPTYRPASQLVPLGGAARLFCEAYLGKVELPDAKNSVTWSKSDSNVTLPSHGRIAQHKVSRENNQIIGSYLEIEDITLEDYGEYKCEVSNGVDEEITLPAHVYQQDGKESDALVCYHEKDSNLAIGIVIPTLESRHRYKCTSLELSQLNQNWALEIGAHVASSRRIIVILSPACLGNVWNEASVGPILNQLSSLATRTIAIVTKDLPSATTIAKRSNRGCNNSTELSLDRLKILHWDEAWNTSGSGDHNKFWYKLRLAMPPVRPISTEGGCQSVAMIVQANGKCGQQKARSRESLEVLV